MVIIFDLDDTLYEEMCYVKSGLNTVASHLSYLFKIKKKTIYNKLLKVLKENGRGKVFNIICSYYKFKKKNLVKDLINIYRSHKPLIKLKKEAIKILEYYSGYNKYIITDGNYLVQKKKVKYLKLSNYFKKIFYTNFYGVKYNKPSLFCFNKIKKLEKCDWSDLVYVGDNPYKDFINCNKKRILTVRLMQGQYKSLKVKKLQDAKFKISNLLLLKKIIN
jgi:putative hydrolase of the HAD superfamily